MNKVLLATSLLLLQLISVSCGERPGAENKVETATTATVTRVAPSKRSLIGFGGFEELNGAWPNDWNQFNTENPWNGPKLPVHQAWAPHKPVPSQMEVSSAIAAAKQASENVLIAQQQMIAAKENVVQQQKLASDREANAQLAQQKLESVAAIQRSESASAAQGVILAQQRLAATKAALAHHQKVASVKEAHAAEFLRSSAHAAALEIQRTEHEAEKLSTLHRNGAAASSHHVTATKDALLAPLFVGGNQHRGGSGAGPFGGPWSTMAPTPGMTQAFINSWPQLQGAGHPAGGAAFFGGRNAPLFWG